MSFMIASGWLKTETDYCRQSQFIAHCTLFELTLVTDNDCGNVNDWMKERERCQSVRGATQFRQSLEG
jgi:hypothetical protein